MKRLHSLPAYWDNYAGGPLSPDDNPVTGLDATEISALTNKLTHAPEGFHVHPKVAKLLEQRSEMGNNKRTIDYGFAELLAYASLLKSGTPVRLSGQDSQRGTFNQRHSVLIDTETEVRWSPLSHIAPDGKQGRWQCYNSMLSEAAVLGYEYGYARDYPEALVLWEAQFGDFANGAQIIIDQFIAAGEAKWGLLSGIVLLLPHGYEGQGPEHSSARMERFLQLAAQENIQITQPSTAAQYFHLLRRQAMRKWRKPLIVFTPKSMLRHPDAMSTVPDFSVERFQPVLADTSVTNAAARPHLLRQNRPQPPRRARQAQDRKHRHHLRRPALPLARSRAHRRHRATPERARNRLGPGRARQHGRPRLRNASPPQARRQPRRPLGQAHRQRQPRNRQPQSPRARRKNPHRPRLRPLSNLAFGLKPNRKGPSSDGPFTFALPPSAQRAYAALYNRPHMKRRSSAGNREPALKRVSTEVAVATKGDRFGRFSSAASGWLGSKWAFAGAILIIVGWAASGPLFHFSDTWQLVINTGTTIVTFLMVSSSRTRRTATPAPST